MSKTVETFKMPFKTKFFNKGQKVFVLIKTGNLAIKVRGRFRGKYKRINAWFKYRENDACLFDVKEIEISEKDYKSIFNIN